MRYECIFFDLDGTITEPFEGITKALCYSLEKFGIKVEDRNTLKVCIGPPLWDTYTEMFGLSEDDARKAVEYYREYYDVGGFRDCLVYNGIEEMLKKLSDSPCKVALATSKPEKMAKLVLENFGLDKYFDFICGASMDQSRSSKASVVAYALKTAGITDKKRCVMVGDRKFDVEGARENGLSTIGVTYGYGDRLELETAGAKEIFDDAFSLCDFLTR
jgi:phosphoglycolate phosphatase